LLLQERSVMDDELCPPWWPNFLWWLIHHPPHNREPFLDEVERARILEATQHVLVALQTFTYAHFTEGELREQVQEDAVQKMHKGIEELSGIAAATR
jgi:hypothetical protein